MAVSELNCQSIFRIVIFNYCKYNNNEPILFYRSHLAPPVVCWRYNVAVPLAVLQISSVEQKIWLCIQVYTWYYFQRMPISGMSITKGDVINWHRLLIEFPEICRKKSNQTLHCSCFHSIDRWITGSPRGTGSVCPCKKTSVGNVVRILHEWMS